MRKIHLKPNEPIAVYMDGELVLYVGRGFPSPNDGKDNVLISMNFSPDVGYAWNGSADRELRRQINA